MRDPDVELPEGLEITQDKGTIGPYGQTEPLQTDNGDKPGDGTVDPADFLSEVPEED